VKGGGLDKTLTRDSDLDRWKKVVRDPLYENDCWISYKIKGVYKETSMHDMITDLMEELSFQDFLKFENDWSRSSRQCN